MGSALEHRDSRVVPRITDGLDQHVGGDPIRVVFDLDASGCEMHPGFRHAIERFQRLLDFGDA